MSCPKIIYKYRNFTSDNHKRVLTNNELFYSSPKDFNDPFDCRIPPSLRLLDSDEKIENYVDTILIQHFDTLSKNGYDIKELMDDYTSRLKNDIEEEQEAANKREFKEQDFWLGVLSMSTKWNSILMWSHYGDFHKGICYGFYEDSLRNSDRFIGGREVCYSRKFPLIDPFEYRSMNGAFAQTHTKARKWKYEKEYRFSIWFEQRTAPKSNSRKVCVKDSNFAEIILGIEFPEKDVSEVLNIAKDKGIVVYRAEKIPETFKMTRTKLI